jgi:hypothetical protein
MQKTSLLSLPTEILLQIYTYLPPASLVPFSHTSCTLHHLFATSHTHILSTYNPQLFNLLSITAKDYPSYPAAIATHTRITATIKSRIRKRCANFLSRHLLCPRNEADEVAFDTAIYNVWSFNALFSAESEVREKQVAWLKRPGAGLGMKELREILEVHQCIGALVTPLMDNVDAVIASGVFVPGPANSSADGGLERTWVEGKLEDWGVWVQTLQMDIVEQIVAAGELGGWGAVSELVVLKKWICHQQKEFEGGGRLFLRGALGEVYAELSNVERKRVLEERWGREGVWGDTWEV